MGKKQPKINYRKKGNSYSSPSSSKKSKKSNIHSKRNKKKFTNFLSHSGYSSKKSSKKKFFENSSKRKRRKDESPRYTNITNNNIINNHNNFFIFNSVLPTISQNKERPEWMSKETESIEDNKDRFNKEILEYVEYITPNNESLSQRQSTMNFLKQIINKKKPEWKVYLFGSFRQKTSTVFSDLDFEIIIDNNSSRKRDIDELFYLKKILNSNGFSKDLYFIKARVPILKGTCSLTGISVDISVNRHNGYQAADLIKRIISKHRILRPIIIILKILLKKYSYNEAHTGGMSSFLLFHLVYFFFIRNKNNLINLPSNDWELSNKNEIKEKYVEDNSDLEESDESKSNKGFTLTKAASNSDDEFNSNEEDSNMVQNGVSSSDSDIEQKNDSKEYNIFENKTKLSTVLNSSDEYNHSSGDKNGIDKENDFDEVKILSDTKLTPYYENKDNYGDFLLKFLFFFGFEFKYNDFGIKVTEDETCETYFKAQRLDMDCSDTISVESIQDPGNDIGKSCYQYFKIKRLFFNTYNTIRSEMNHNTVSILQALEFPNV